jgi:AcrR family transcriptional regulator
MAKEAIRDRVIRAAAQLLTEQGREAVTTRSVSAMAGLNPPAIYRQFADKDGLLDAVASYGFREYLISKGDIGYSGDPIDDLRRAWDLHIAFGFAQPAFYVLAFGDPKPGRTVPAAADAVAGLRLLVARVARAGQLRTNIEQATAMLYAAGVGVVLSQLTQPPADRDPEVPALLWNSILTAITHGESRSPAPTAVAGHAAALREAVRAGEVDGLTRAERDFFAEWLGRIR